MFTIILSLRNKINSACTKTYSVTWDTGIQCRLYYTSRYLLQIHTSFYLLYLLHLLYLLMCVCYVSVLHRLLCIRMPYSASEMFVSCGIPSFYELLRKCIFDFSERISKNTNSIIEACLSTKVYIFSPIRQWWRSVLF